MSVTRTHHSNCTTLCVPIQSSTGDLKFLEYEISSLLLDLFATPAFGTHCHRQDKHMNDVKTTRITLVDETDQSIKDLLQYLLHPYHFPITLGNYSNLLRLAMKYQIVSLVEELIVFMNEQREPKSVEMFLEACKYHLGPVKDHFEKDIVAHFATFILRHTREQLAVVDSDTMNALIQKQSTFPHCLGVEQVQAFRLLYSYALQGELYTDLLDVRSIPNFIPSIEALY